MQKIVRFEPHDGTSYLVIFHRMTDAEKAAVGGFDDGPVVLFGFSERSVPIKTYAFRDSGGGMAYGYYSEKLDIKQGGEWTGVAGSMVFEALTGREIFNYGHEEKIHRAITHEWGDDWADQLRPLLEQ
jgi:hypothetical protein